MNKPCKDCNGRGSWQEHVENASEEELVWRFCNTCYGTGISQDPEDGDDFDFGGSSYVNDDDD